MLKRSVYIVFVFFILSVLVLFYFYRGKFVKDIFPNSWLDIKSQVLSDCLMIDKTNNDAVGDITVRIKNASKKYMDNKSGDLKMYLMYDPGSESDSLRCRIGWLGDLEVGVSRLFYVNLDNELIHKLVKAPLK